MASSSHTGFDLNKEYAHISLEEEEEGILIGDDNEGEEVAFDDRWCLVGKFLTGRTLDFDAMRHMMASLWQPGKGVYIKELDTNRYLFQFYHEIDVQVVIDGSPWTFNRIPLIFHRLKRGEDPKLVRLHHLNLWVQIHNLKTGYMLEEVVRRAGDYVGKFVKNDPKNFNGIWREYLRVRATVDIEKPLKRRMKLCKDNGDWIWANFKYEHIPTFCFVCGLIGHAERLCPRRFDEDFNPLVKPYGNGMRAQTRRKNYLIGAQWLRTGSEQQETIDGDGDERHSGVNVTYPIGAKIMEIDSINQGGEITSMIAGKNKSVIVGSNGHNEDISEGEKGGKNNGKVVDCDDELLILLDSKRRRRDMVQASRASELVESELGQDNMGSIGSKNDLKVGLVSQAHQSS
ncbi:uncharacterized protein LOC115713529 [Cannabis sativa]|uniref:uncharacterized protein LOC115713529 n=1 Tax=Cannabis sativa TaxID=3483 RepID=UPI0029CA3413|nr:uncharacterized protein LOC115713529 [Cannabis sativa]